MTNEQPRLGVMCPGIRMVKFKSTASVYPPLGVHLHLSPENNTQPLQAFRNRWLSVTNSVTNGFCNGYIVTATVTAAASAAVFVTVLQLQKWIVTRFVTPNLLKENGCNGKRGRSPAKASPLIRRGKGDSDSLTIGRPGYGAYCQLTKRQQGGVTASPTYSPVHEPPQASFVQIELTGGVSSWL